VAQILRQFGFEVISQRGSHMKLRCIGLDGRSETLTIPAHRELDTGTCRAILRQASRFIPISQLTPFFYSE
jgi:predicted RNA binding protein YcfA (HicA-like mRNA interferase family)